MQTFFIWVALIAVAFACYYFFGRDEPPATPPVAPPLVRQPTPQVPASVPLAKSPQPFTGADKRSADQATAEGNAFEKGTLPEQDRRQPK